MQLQRFKSILVIINGDGDILENLAISRVASLAKHNDATLTLMDVVKMPRSVLSGGKSLVGVDDLKNLIVKRREDE